MKWSIYGVLAFMYKNSSEEEESRLDKFGVVNLLSEDKHSFHSFT